MVTRIGGGRRPHLYIKEWMEHRNLSDRQLADRMEVARETIWRWHNEQHRLRPEKIAAIAAALDLQPEDLYRPPERPSLDAMIKDAPKDVQDMVIDIVSRMVNRKAS